MSDGTRTHDDRDHNPGLYQLSYAHHRSAFVPDIPGPGSDFPTHNDIGNCGYVCSRMVRPAGLEPATLGLAYQLPLSRPRQAGLWSGLSLRHLRRHTYSLYGALR